MGAKGSKAKMLKTDEVVRVYETLKHCLKKVNGSDEWAYIDNHSDVTVAEALSVDIPNITATNVIGVRERCFGKLWKPSPERTMGDRVVALEKCVADLYRKLNETDSAILSLSDKLDKQATVYLP